MCYVHKKHLFVILVKSNADLILCTVVAGSLALLVLLVSALVLVLMHRRRKNQRAGGDIKQTDENPVYGMYYFSTGDHIDESKSEVVDGNDYYC